MPSCHRRRKAAVSGPVILLMCAAALDLESDYSRDVGLAGRASGPKELTHE